MFKALLTYLSSIRYTIDTVGEVISSIRGPELGNSVVALGELGRLEMASFFGSSRKAEG